MTQKDPATPSPDKARTPETAPISRPTDRPKEVGGQKGPEPTRYGDWEKNGIISDF